MGSHKLLVLSRKCNKTNGLLYVNSKYYVKNACASVQFVLFRTYDLLDFTFTAIPMKVAHFSTQSSSGHDYNF